MSYHISKTLDVPFDKAIDNPDLVEVATTVRAKLQAIVENL